MANTQEPYEKCIEFFRYIEIIVESLNDIGVNLDTISEPLEEEVIINITRDFLYDDFPRDKYAYAPIKKEIKETNLNKTKEFDANILVTEDLFDIYDLDDIIIKEETSYIYDVKPPVAILKYVGKIRKEPVLLVPNMDINLNLQNDYEKYIYYRLSTFHPAIVSHGLAYYFLKNYDYATACILGHLLSRFNVIIDAIKTMNDISETEKQEKLNQYRELYENYKKVSSLAGAVYTAIKNATGILDADVSTIIRYVSNSINDTETLEWFQNSEQLYNNAKQNILAPQLKFEMETYSEIVTYAPLGEMILVSRKKSEISGYGKRILDEDTYKVSKQSVINVIPLLRERIDTSKDSSSSTQITENQQPLNISVSTTSWEDASVLKDLMSGISYQNKVYSFNETDIHNLEYIIENIAQFHKASLSWNAVSGDGKINIITQSILSS